MSFMTDFLSIGAIISGILVITSSNPVMSVLFLICVFVNVAGYLIITGVGFIGLSYIIVYVGAIAVLFLFVIMMLNLQLAELSSIGREYTQNMPLATIIGSLFMFEMLNILPTNMFLKDLSNVFGNFNTLTSKVVGSQSDSLSINNTFNMSITDTTMYSSSQISSIGEVIYTNGTMWLIICGIILLLSMVGPITLSLNKSST